jgi:hypothetical protein
MPRKSMDRRRLEGKELLARFEKANLSDSWEYGFLNSIALRMESGKQLTKKQRAMFDKMVDEGVPSPKGDIALLEKIDTALKGWHGNEDREWESNAMNSMRRNVFKGWDLSKKQSEFLNSMLEKYSDDISGKNIFTPTPDQIDDLKVCIDLYNGYAPMWRSDRPALKTAIERTSSFIEGNRTIEKYHYEKVYNAIRARLIKFKYPKFKKGDLGTLSYNGKTSIAFCTSDVYINNGNIVNDWMTPDNKVSRFSQDLPRTRL